MSNMKMKIMKSRKAVVSATEPTNTHKYQEALDYINSAIQALGDAAKNGDSLAKESIANLGVIMLDLK